MKTLTLRVADNGAKRNISNFIEYATLQYLTSSQYIDNDEMSEILEDKELIKSLNQGLKEAKNKDYTIV